MAAMTRRVTHYRNKTYIRIPHGEIQYGRISRQVHVWYRGKLYHLHARRWPVAVWIWVVVLFGVYLAVAGLAGVLDGQ